MGCGKLSPPAGDVAEPTLGIGRDLFGCGRFHQAQLAGQGKSLLAERGCFIKPCHPEQRAHLGGAQLQAQVGKFWRCSR